MAEERIEDLAEDLYHTVFEWLDGEPDVDSMEAGRVAHLAAQAFRKAMREDTDEA